MKYLKTHEEYNEDEYKNWKVGDIITCIVGDPNLGFTTIKNILKFNKKYIIDSINKKHDQVSVVLIDNPTEIVTNNIDKYFWMTNFKHNNITTKKDIQNWENWEAFHNANKYNL